MSRTGATSIIALQALPQSDFAKRIVSMVVSKSEHVPLLYPPSASYASLFWARINWRLTQPTLWAGHGTCALGALASFICGPIAMAQIAMCIAAHPSRRRPDELPNPIQFLEQLGRGLVTLLRLLGQELHDHAFESVRDRHLKLGGFLGHH